MKTLWHGLNLWKKESRRWVEIVFVRSYTWLHFNGVICKYTFLYSATRSHQSEYLKMVSQLYVAWRTVYYEESLEHVSLPTPARMFLRCYYFCCLLCRVWAFFNYHINSIKYPIMHLGTQCNSWCITCWLTWTRGTYVGKSPSSTKSKINEHN